MICESSRRFFDSSKRYFDTSIEGIERILDIMVLVANEFNKPQVLRVNTDYVYGSELCLALLCDFGRPIFEFDERYHSVLYVHYLSDKGEYYSRKINQERVAGEY